MVNLAARSSLMCRTSSKLQSEGRYCFLRGNWTSLPIEELSAVADVEPAVRMRRLLIALKGTVFTLPNE